MTLKDLWAASKERNAAAVAANADKLMADTAYDRFRTRRARLTLVAGYLALLVLIPSLLYYGGGWLQYGYRYFLDSVPFVIALCGSAAAMRGTIGLGWRALIVFGVIVMAAGAYWAHVI